MKTSVFSRLLLTLGVTALVAGVPAVPVLAEDQTAQEERQEKTAQIPVCEKKLGTIAIASPEHNWWTQYQLESPESLIKIYVNESKCFTLLDRGKGMAAAQAERALASSGELRGGSNIGKGQVKAADYVLVPDLVSKNSNSGGKSMGGILGGMLGGVVGGVIGGINLKKKTADVVLTVTDVRSSEQMAMTEGHGEKSDLSWAGAGGAFFGAFAAGGAGGYSNTEIGQVISLAYLQAYTKLVDEFKNLPASASAANETQAVTMAKPGRMYASSSGKGTVVRELDPGMMLYPTGEKQGMIWEVEDELGNKGWVSSVLFQLSR